VAGALGYRVEQLAMARARIFSPPVGGHDLSPWGPVLRSTGPHGLRVGEAKATRVAPSPPGPSGRRSGSAAGAAGTRAEVVLDPVDQGVWEEGTWGLAVLSRRPLRSASLIDLGQMRHDPVRRGAIVVEFDVDGGVLKLIGTHLAHLTNGSILQLRTLQHLVADPGTPSVLLGDMNMWGPPLSALLPGWRRAVRGRTWPAWRPLAQLDHILVTKGVTATAGQVVPVPGSDHLPVRARVALR
jgi:endonuclease/exonuclease/phosphatase family metal-dependent hydrolase